MEEYPDPIAPAFVPCEECSFISATLSAHADTADIFVSASTSPQEIADTTVLDLSDSENISLARGGEEVTLCTVGRISYNPHISHYGNFSALASSGNYEYVNDIKDARKVVSIGGLPNDPAWDNMCQALRSIESNLYEAMLVSHEADLIDLNSVVDKNGNVRCIHKLFSKGTGRGSVSPAEDPDRLIRDLLAQKRHDLNPLRPTFRRYLNPTESLDWADHPGSSFATRDHVSVTFTVVPYAYTIDGRLKLGLQLHLDDLAFIHRLDSIRSPSRSRIRNFPARVGRRIATQLLEQGQHHSGAVLPGSQGGLGNVAVQGSSGSAGPSSVTEPFQGSSSSAVRPAVVASGKASSSRKRGTRGGSVSAAASRSSARGAVSNPSTGDSPFIDSSAAGSSVLGKRSADIRDAANDIMDAEMSNQSGEPPMDEQDMD